MELYLIRHGLAQPLGQKNDFSDEKRALTSQGRDRMREIVRGLHRLGVALDLIMSSPLVRAVETASIVAEGLGMDEKLIELTSNLSPGSSADELLAEIKQRKRTESLALVGHEPDLGLLVARIISSNGDCRMSIPLKKGGVCCIQVRQTVPTFRGSLTWLLTPKPLRLLAKS
jgi:phosphohistidine phosphatase